MDEIILAMIDYYSGDPERIQHFLKVYEFSGLIGRAEGLDGDTLDTLLTAAIVHDIGIKLCEEKYGRCDGPLQEKEGPALARKLLTDHGVPAARVERVCNLVGRHHTYTGIDGIDCQILIEADFLVNLFEGRESETAIKSAHDAIFKTASGTKICETMFAMKK